MQVVMTWTGHRQSAVSVQRETHVVFDRDSAYRKGATDTAPSVVELDATPEPDGLARFYSVPEQ